MPPERTETMKADVLEAGIVENVNVKPPFTGVNGSDTALVDETLKSSATPVTVPVALRTVIVHAIIPPTRRGFAAEHESDEDVVGFP